jgi:potassium-transporting ATPase potassium-binding subunit
MTVIGWFQIIVFCAIVVALVKPLGGYMTRVFTGARTLLSPVLRPVEAGLYWIGGVDEKREQHWLTYTVGMLLFHVGGFIILYALLRLQAFLPFNPAGQSAVAEDLSFNTAISFITNTNWQNYGGESTMSYLVQMLGLTSQNFLSAATGIVLAVALIRGFARTSVRTVGNFWVDITRCTLYVLLPICVPLTLFLVGKAFRKRSVLTSTRSRSRAPGRLLRSARWHRRSRSSCSAPTAEASSTPTPRIRSRIRRRCRTTCR